MARSIFLLILSLNNFYKKSCVRNQIKYKTKVFKKGIADGCTTVRRREEFHYELIEPHKSFSELSSSHLMQPSIKSFSFKLFFEIVIQNIIFVNSSIFLHIVINLFQTHIIQCGIAFQRGAVGVVLEFENFWRILIQQIIVRLGQRSMAIGEFWVTWTATERWLPFRFIVHKLCARKWEKEKRNF